MSHSALCGGSPARAIVTTPLRARAASVRSQQPASQRVAQPRRAAGEGPRAGRRLEHHAAQPVASGQWLVASVSYRSS
jgi:hypothetical protein